VILNKSSLLAYSRKHAGPALVEERQDAGH
jgi:hypothetical protein